MTSRVVMPAVDGAAADGTVASWYRGVGDRVVKGEALLAVEVEKATIDVEPPSSGYLRRIVVGEGSVCRSGDLLGLVTDTPEEPLEELAEQ
jgi:pyruvate/2-oxoglutarate dehydrogenase complex dihydrolipoamide acyltransferase (E2) component